jgi:hypothetical protein
MLLLVFLIPCILRKYCRLTNRLFSGDFGAKTVETESTSTAATRSPRLTSYQIGNSYHTSLLNKEGKKKKKKNLKEKGGKQQEENKEEGKEREREEQLQKLEDR